MKPTLIYGAITLLSITLLTAQDDIPPAFEEPNSTSSERATESTYDPFDPVVSAPKIIRTQVEFIEVSHKDLTRLLMEDKTKTTDATALRMKLHAMVNKDAAKVIETQINICRSGEMSTSESISEFIYPTEYDPPGSKGDKTTQAYICSAFETRNLGSTLEADPVIDSKNKIIDVHLTPELVYHTGNTVWQESKDQSGNTIKVQMPDFYTIRINTAINCISGQYVLAGVVSPKNDAGKPDLERKLMVFVKADILAVTP